MAYGNGKEAGGELDHGFSVYAIGMVILIVLTVGVTGIRYVF